MDSGPNARRLRLATARRRRMETRLAQARQDERAAIAAAIDSGELRQVDVVSLTGYTREHVRRLVLTERAGSPSGQD